MFEADELPVLLDDGSVEGLAEDETEAIDVVLTLTESDALWLPDADRVVEKLPLSLTVSEALGELVIDVLSLTDTDIVVAMLRLSLLEGEALDDMVSLNVILLLNDIDVLTLPEMLRDSDIVAEMLPLSLLEGEALLLGEGVSDAAPKLRETVGLGSCKQKRTFNFGRKAG